MAYLRYKEITKYFNFNKRIDADDLPNYVLDYLDDGEKIISAYKTFRDRGLFTETRMILFDVTPFTGEKKIHILPYSSISSGAVSFGLTKSALLFTYDSGYQLRLDFTIKGEDKRDLRLLYSHIMKNK